MTFSKTFRSVTEKNSYRRKFPSILSRCNRGIATPTF